MASDSKAGTHKTAITTKADRWKPPRRRPWTTKPGRQGDADGFDVRFVQGEDYPWTSQNKDLGMGTYGQVQVYRLHETGENVAIKSIQIDKPGHEEITRNEVKTMRKSLHYHIVEIRGSCITSDDFYKLLLCPVADYTLTRYLNEYATIPSEEKLLRAF